MRKGVTMNRLKELRLHRGLLQSDIAKIINKSERTVGFYETGERDMGTETLGILADFFNVSVDYLLGRDINESIQVAAKAKNGLDLSDICEEDKQTIMNIYNMIKEKNKDK